ncbi:hypothetical protein N0V94_008081 [Neodidymelliopsis sp. IMI 364377]|nr:hypothetical protein N0V94_008081 [Neodidymelliopsis sp. IMI 364377]
MEDPADDASKTDAYTTAKPSRFHFKSTSERRKRRHDRRDSEERSSKRHRSGDESDTTRSHRSSRRKHRHRHGSSHADGHPTSTRDGEYYDPDHRYRESLFDDVEASADHDTFRESLFDALADDEGAAYWEGVYGQPVHVYPATKPGPDGKLERMTEDEYAEFVRTKMWEKSHQHIVEEREAREKARQERKRQRQRYDDDADSHDKERESIRRQMEDSLRRGEERKKAKEAAAAWDLYTKKWEFLSTTHNTSQEQESEATTETKARDLIPWPVFSGKTQHVEKSQIERFLRASPAWKGDAAALLKAERVRWHPDKMQRRFGQHIDDATIKAVTVVFQVVDQMWNARRS